MDNLTDVVIVRSKVTALRTRIAELATFLRAHIGARKDAHPAPEVNVTGFMSAELYKKLLGFQEQIDALKSQISAADLPNGAMLYYYNSPSTIPEGYVLCDGNNGTLNFSDKYALGINNNADLGITGGSKILPSVPMPRHRHMYKNYICCEVWKELQYTVSSNSNVVGEYSNNKYGSCVGGSVSSIYPLYYTDYTEYAGSTTTTPSISIMPPYRGLHVIKRSTAEPVYASDSVGSLHVLVNAKSVPAGMFKCDGQWISATIYNDLYRYALSSGLIVTESTYTSQLNTYGSAPVFAYNSTSNLLRLPTLNSVIAVRSATGVTNTAAKAEEEHFHGLGKMDDNNGTWGRLSYSNATYPANTEGYFWNGSGDHSTEASPDYAGDIITSCQINVGQTGNGEICDSTNIVICIRAYHASISTVYENDIEADATVLKEMLDEAAPVQYLSGTPGFRKENGGITEVWGTVAVGAAKGNDVISITLPIPLSTKVSSVMLDVAKAESVVSPVLIEATTTTLKFKVLGDFTDTVEVQYRILGH